MGKSILEKHRDLRSLAGKYGIDHTKYASTENSRDMDYGSRDAPGSEGWQMSDLKEKILATMNSDWNVRESINAGINTGHKNFKDFDNGGIRGIEEAMAVDKAMKKVYKHANGNGGSWGSSAHGLGGHGDRGGVAETLMARDRAQLLESMETPENQEKEPKVKKPKEIQLPRYMAEAMAEHDTFREARRSGAWVQGTRDANARADFAQKLKDQYVQRLTEYGSRHQAGKEPWQVLGKDEQEDGPSVMPYSAAGIAML